MERSDVRCVEMISSRHRAQHLLHSEGEMTFTQLKTVKQQKAINSAAK